MTTNVPDSDGSPWTGELRLDPQIHGKSRVPGPKAAGFSLLDFAEAVEERDLDLQAAQYALEAETVVAASTGRIDDELITMRTTVLVWDHDVSAHR